MINVLNKSARRGQDIHVRCINYVVNIAVKVCLTEVHGHISQIRALLSAILSYLKSHYILETKMATWTYSCHTVTLYTSSMVVNFYNDPWCFQIMVGFDLNYN